MPDRKQLQDLLARYVWATASFIGGYVALAGLYVTVGEVRGGRVHLGEGAVMLGVGCVCAFLASVRVFLAEVKAMRLLSQEPSE